MASPRTDAGALLGGELRVRGPLPRASNATFLAELSGASQPTLVVYKPRLGERPLWDFPDGTLCNREAAAWVLADALGWPSIPPTVLRDGPHGEGAVQLFVEHDPAEHYLTLHEGREDVFRAFAAFDVVANNADRKSGHCLLGRDGRVWGVDHGVCFSTRPTLRTVVWEFAGKEVPRGLAADLTRVAGELRADGELRERLGELLSEDEVEATAARAEALVAAGRFPEPGPHRSIPWPPV